MASACGGSLALMDAGTRVGMHWTVNNTNIKNKDVNKHTCNTRNTQVLQNQYFLSVYIISDISI